MLKDQVLLVENPDITVQRCTTLHSATLLPCPDEGTPIHSCEETIHLAYVSRRDVKDQPRENSDKTWFTDGSSFVREGIRHAGYATVTPFEAIETKALPPTPGISAQLAERITLTRALHLGRDKRINIYTDSKFAFLVLHVAIWKEEDAQLPKTLL